jgi:hypothetical protein
MNADKTNPFRENQIHLLVKPIFSQVFDLSASIGVHRRLTAFLRMKSTKELYVLG